MKKEKKKKFDLDLDAIPANSKIGNLGSALDSVASVGKMVSDTLTSSSMKQITESIAKVAKNKDLFSGIEFPSLDYLPKMPEPIEIDGSWLAEESRRKADQARLTRMQIKILERQLDKEKYPNPKYNTLNNVLIFQDRNIVIPPDTDQSALCRVIFEDIKSMRRVWDFDVMLEEWGIKDYNKKDLRRVYRAGREVNKKIAMQTMISDLLDINTKTISVNLKYIKT